MKKLILLIVLFNYYVGYTQENLLISNNHEFIGIHNNKIIYRCNDYKSNNYNQLFEIVDFYSRDKKIITISDQTTDRQIFISDEFSIFYSKNRLEITYNKLDFFIENINIDNQIDVDLNNKTLYCAHLIGNNYLLCQIIINTSNEIIVNDLPIYGMNPKLNGNYLYFSSKHICDWYSDFPDDIYRVKTGEWNNPELVLENVVSKSWFIIPETNVVYARIKLDEKGKGILYDFELKSYKIINQISGNKVIKYEGKSYYEISQRNKPISYQIIELPQEYPFKDNRVICPNEKKKIVNLSDKEKIFASTFITEELLYNSTNTDLLKLTKDELRILRNAFYARQGYQFNSQDLQEFFGQFEWYHRMVERNIYLEIQNEDVVISTLDKERVELITEIENNK
jgi:hypothetical protein